MYIPIVLLRIIVLLQIELSFLMVGHTHEDIDQSFSCLSRYLRKHDALTVSGEVNVETAKDKKCYGCVQIWKQP